MPDLGGALRRQEAAVAAGTSCPPWGRGKCGDSRGARLRRCAPFAPPRPGSNGPRMQRARAPTNLRGGGGPQAKFEVAGGRPEAPGSARGGVPRLRRDRPTRRGGLLCADWRVRYYFFRIY